MTKLASGKNGMYSCVCECVYVCVLHVNEVQFDSLQTLISFATPIAKDLRMVR